MQDIEKHQQPGGTKAWATLSWMLLAALFVGGTARKAVATEIQLSKHIETVKVSGDVRLRQEGFSNGTAGNGQRGRSRQRFRLRLGMELPFPNNLAAKLRFASGTGEQVSTNQSLDNLSSQKSIWIDRAYLEWKPLGNDTVRLSGGRMANPLWTIASSDAVWDDDFNPEGFGQSLDFLAGPVKLFGNGLQMVVDEDSGNQGDQWEFSGQLGAEFRLPLESRLRVASAVHEWVNETTTTRKNAGTFSQVATNKGNRRYASGVLQNEFRVTELTGQFSFWVLRVPVALQGTWIKNTAALDQFNAPKKADKGHQFGAILGKAGAKNSWEAAYFVKKVETDATVADVSDSDFGEGGTGRKGSILWLAYNPQDWAQFKVKYFMTKLDEPILPPTVTGNRDHDLNRLQVDLSVKF